jgi:hypothetical protein
MLLVILGSGLSVLLLAIVVLQTRSTRTGVQRADAVNASEAGIEVTLAQIRAAVKSDGSGVGDQSRLPCGPVTGAVSGGGPASYTVAITYLLAKPPSGDASWAATHKIACTAGVGPASLPMYALLQSTGAVGSAQATRTLFGTYTLHTVNSGNIPGGLLPVMAKKGPPTMCLSADSDTLVGGEYVVLRMCDSTNTREKFSYEVNLNIVLVSSRTQARPGGLCLDAGTPQVAGAYVRFQPCASATVPHQQWGENDYSAFQGTTDGATLNNFCINVQDVGTLGSRMILNDQTKNNDACYKDWSPLKTFFPDAYVGSGGAGPLTNQLVNWSQFGRCIDVTADDVKESFLVVFPCKQSPSGSVLWNQTWQLPTPAAGATSATGAIWTTYNGTPYCLVSPGSTVDKHYITVKSCTPANPGRADMLWTYRSDTGLYAESYRIESTFGAPSGSVYCVSPSGPTDLWTDWTQDISKLVLDPCSSDKLQKWNASPNIVQGQLRDVVER